MKIYIIILILAVNCLTAETAFVKTKLDSVKVYLQGAELSHSAKVKLNKGKNILKFEGVASGLNENSIRINTEKEMDIMSVSLKNEKIEVKKTQELLAIEDSMRKLEYRIQELKNEKSALNEELEMVKSNKNVGGSTGTTALQIRDMADFFRARIMEIKTRLSKIDLENDALKEKEDKLKANLEKVQGKNPRSTSDFIELVINCDTETNNGFVITYYTNLASWYPEYNVKVKDITSKPDLYYKAKVKQNSGIDWEDIDITLSTANPTISLIKPIINTLFASFYTPQVLSNQMIGSVTSNKSTTSTGSGFNIRGARISETQIRVDGLDIGNQLSGYYGFAGRAEMPMVSQYATEQVQLVQGGYTAEYGDVAGGFISTAININFEYKPAMKYTIPNDNRFYTVNMQMKPVEADFEYYCAPAYSKDVFLIAKIRNWEGLNLLPGYANVYYNNSYNGVTYISPATTDSILQITLALDKEIIVERKQIQEYREGKFLSSNNEKTYGYNISVRNTKNKAVTIVIEDQAPVSGDEDIEIEVSQNSGSDYNKRTGITRWLVSLQPGEKSEKQLVYSITAPGNKPLQIR